MDKLFERLARAVAQRSSRRSFRATLGKMILGASIIPLLPIDRVAATADATGPKSKNIDDDTTCDYWKYCAIDGYLCSCCGGGSHHCPPRPAPSPNSSGGSSRHPPACED